MVEKVKIFWQRMNFTDFLGKMIMGNFLHHEQYYVCVWGEISRFKLLSQEVSCLWLPIRNFYGLYMYNTTCFLAHIFLIRFFQHAWQKSGYTTFKKLYESAPCGGFQIKPSEKLAPKLITDEPRNLETLEMQYIPPDFVCYTTPIDLEKDLLCKTALISQYFFWCDQDPRSW